MYNLYEIETLEIHEALCLMNETINPYPVYENGDENQYYLDTDFQLDSKKSLNFN